MRITEQEYLTALEVVKNYKEQILNEVNLIFNEINIIHNDEKIINIEMTSRLFNCIKEWIDKGGDINNFGMQTINIDNYYISYFNDIDLNKFKRVRNLGQKSLIEFEEILTKYKIKYIKPKSYYFS